MEVLASDCVGKEARHGSETRNAPCSLDEDAGSDACDEDAPPVDDACDEDAGSVASRPPLPFEP